MPFKVKVLWVICCIFIFLSFSFVSMQRSIQERRAESEKRATKKIEEFKRQKQIQEFKKKSFQEAADELKELVALGQYDEVKKRAREILDKNPENAPAFTWWGITLVKTNELPQAIEKFEKASQFDQSNPRTYLYWGLTLAMQRKFDEAILKYRTTLQLAPESSNAYAYWGGALANLDNYSAAIEKLQKALDLNPYNAIALGVLVDAYFETRQYDKAWQVVAQARKGKVTLNEDSLKRLRDARSEPET